MRKVKEMLHHGTAAPAATSTTGAPVSSLPQSSLVAQQPGMLGQQQQFGNPYASQYNLPPNIANWQTGQPIPQGWRLGRKGYLKPIFTPPAYLSTWQQGQPIPEGYRLSKRGTLRPINYFSWWASQSAGGFGQQQQVIAERTTVIEKDTFLQQPVAAPITQVNVTAPVVEIIEKPPVVQEVVRPSLREEIQPVIHREREQLEIRENVQPIYEKTVMPTVVEERNLGAEVREAVQIGTAPIIAEGPKSSTFVEAEHREAFMHAPIVEETVHKKVIEEVTPVIHREVIAPKLINERQDIYEKIVEAPTVTYTTLPPMVQEVPVVPAPPQLAEVVTTTTVTTETEFVPSAAGLVGGMQNLSTGTAAGTAGAVPAEKKHHFNFLHRPKSVNKQ